MANTATIQKFGLQTGSSRTLYATWSWNKDHTANYEVRWTYSTGDGVDFVGSSSTTTEKQSTYSIPDNATAVMFTVKPVSETYTTSTGSSKSSTKSTSMSYWTAGWSTKKTYYVANLPPDVPGGVDVTIDKYTLKATINNVAANTESIEFQIVQNDLKVFNTGIAAVRTSTAIYQCAVDAGYRYKVRARGVRKGVYSDWTEYSDNNDTIPKPPTGITELKALSKTSVSVAWDEVTTATSYTIEYTDKLENFDVTSSTTTVTVDVGTRFTVTGLESGHEYFFRVKASNSEGDSPYTDPKSVIVGKKPTAPTTWSNSSTIMVGEALNLYWIHNSVDGSSQTYAELELTVNGSTQSYSIQNSADEDEKDKTSVYTVQTNVYAEGTTIEWRVRTRGVTEDFSDWSIQRTVNVYAPPTLQLTVSSSLTAYPLAITAIAGPATQKPIGFAVQITAMSSYETTDEFGKIKMVGNGEVVYSKYYDTNKDLSISLTPGDINLENNIRYKISCSVSMNSGLSKTETTEFVVGWGDSDCYPNANITYDSNTYSVSIRPYCTNSSDVEITGWHLAVYRREYNGEFTEIGSGIPSKSNTHITDPHPALDYARYRIVATNDSNGSMEYYDVPGYPIGETSIIIQWNDEWTNRDDGSPDALAKPSWSGSLLRLPYNVDISNTTSPDVTMVKYIGRSHPVSYYGTHKGETASWTTAIATSDSETIYALNRLANWMGDVYARAPDGTGFWAHVTLSYSLNHNTQATDVSLNLTRVNGGI